MRIERVGKYYKTSEANGWVYSASGISPTICVGAHGGVEPRITITMNEMNKSKLNRYVRYIYRLMMTKYGKEKVREEALKVFSLATPERVRVRETQDQTLSPEFREKLLALLEKWEINTRYVNELTSVFGTPEDLDQILLDLMPIRIRIRKLTPKECMRLQGVTDEDFEKMQAAGLSNSALYKLAGNSICTAPLKGIFTQLMREDMESLF